MSLFQAKITGTGNRPLDSWISTFTTKSAIPVRSEIAQNISYLLWRMYLWSLANEALKSFRSRQTDTIQQALVHSNDRSDRVDWSLMVVHAERRTSRVQVRIRELNLTLNFTCNYTNGGWKTGPDPSKTQSWFRSLGFRGAGVGLRGGRLSCFSQTCASSLHAD